MDRRRFVSWMAGAIVVSQAHAQQPGRSYVVGALLGGNFEDRARYRSVLRERLATHGFVEGRNLRIEVGAFAGHGVGSGQEAARKLLDMGVNAIFSCFDGITRGALAATDSVPIIFAWVADPVLAGIVGNLARPGGNVTGVTSRASELSLKRFELALALVPGAKRVALIGVDYWPYYANSVRPLLVKAAARLRVGLIESTWRSGPVNIEAAHKAGAQVAVAPFGLIVAGFRHTLAAWIAKSLELRLPVIYSNYDEVAAGGLMSYGTNLNEDLRRAADMLARVLKGERPGDLSVDQASRFELAVSLKTAKALDLAIPPSILLRADRVIE